MKKILSKKFLLILLLVAVAVFLAFLFRSRPEPPVQNGTPSTGADFKSIIPGYSSKQDTIAELGKPLNDEESDLLSFKSNNPNLSHQVVTAEDKVTFIKEIVSPNDNKTTEEITSQYGEAPYVLYGPDSVNGFNLYIYPDKGIAYLGHIKEPILLEVWYFQPTSFEDFKQRWATNYSTIHRPIQ
jgi:hypothetical protein